MKPSCPIHPCRWLTFILLMGTAAPAVPDGNRLPDWETALERWTENPAEWDATIRAMLADGESARRLGELPWDSLERVGDGAGIHETLRAAAAEKWRRVPDGDLIRIAGDEEDDAVRLRRLRQLAFHAEADGREIAGLAPLISTAERWISDRERLDFFAREVYQTQDYDMKVPADSPLYPLAAFYRARMLAWPVLESGAVYPFPEIRAKYLQPARGLFTLAANAFPGNRVAAMYLGRPIPPGVEYEAPANAPAWAVYQREALERLADIVHWWIDNRMRPNGEYGGGWGDDCEMWRQWVPVLIAFEDPKIVWAQETFSNRLMEQPHLRGGYHNHMTDVEHTAEDLSDALTPMMHLDPSNPAWEARALRLAELMESLWTGINRRGFLQFKSTYFTADDVDSSPARACGTVYHPRAMQPALLYWMRTGDPGLGRLFSAWLDTWADAAAREERGKPAGALPTAVHWPEGHVGGTGENWWQPENYPTPLYDFPSAMYMMTKTLLLAHHMTGAERYLEPIRSMARIRMEFLAGPDPDAPAGSRAWCGARLDNLAETVAKYRFLTGSREFDALLERENAPYARYRMEGDIQPLEEGLKRCAEALRVNFPGFTSEVRYTDRVFRFPALYGPGFIFEEGAAAAAGWIEKGIMAPGVNHLSLLYETATGDPGDIRYFPMNAARWLTPPRDIAALVTESARDRFSARLYHFGTGPRDMGAETLWLAPGEYRFRLYGARSGRVFERKSVEIAGPGARIDFTLPGRTLCGIEIARADR